MSFITNGVARVADGVREYYSDYVQNKEEAREGIPRNKSVTRVAVVALTILGITLVSFVVSPAGSKAVVPVVLISLLFGYSLYNSYKIFTNAEEVLDNPKPFQIYDGLKYSFNETRLKAQLSKGTFCFERVINLLVKEMTKKKFAQ